MHASAPASSDEKARGGSANSATLDFYKESMRIEECISVAQKFVTFQRSEALLTVADANVAKNLVESETLERFAMEEKNSKIEEARRTRKEIKDFMFNVVNQLKDKLIEVKHLKEAATVAQATRINLKNKRDAYQMLAKQLEDRERDERMKLKEFHERTAKNLITWQELELRQLNKEERDIMRPMNKIKAQQLREIQQKEAEQLRELQHLKAKFNLDQFNIDMEFVETVENAKAQQLVDVQSLDRRQKQQK